MPNATTYTWTVPGGWTITGGAGTASINVTVGAAGQNGNITVTAGNSCGTSAASTLAVTVNPGTPAVPTSSAATAIGCTQFTANWVASANATAYLIDVSTNVGFTAILAGYNGLNVGNVTSFIVTGLNAGTNYWYRIRATNSCGTSGNSTVRTLVTLPATPAVPGTNSANNINCTSFSARWNSSANATTYFLDVSTVNTFATFVPGYQDLNVGNVTSRNVTGLTAGTTYYYRVRAGNSCGTSASNATITTATSPLPSAPGSITGNTSQCAGQTGQQYSIVTVPNTTTYNWTVPAGWTITGGAGTRTITVTAGAAGQNGNITVTPTNGCGTSGPSILAVIVNAKPVAGAITGPKNTVCIGSTLALTSNASGAAPFTYTWASSSGGVASVNGSGVVTGVGVGTTNITYTVTDANGCSSTSANYPVTVTRPTANPITQATNQTTVCVGSTLSLTSNATGTAPLTYTWASSDNTKATVSSTGVVTGVATGSVNITYTVTDANGCTATSAPYAITVNATPTGSFTATETSGTANDNIICAGANVTFTAPGGNGAYTFRVDGAIVQGPNTTNTFSTTSLTNGQSVTVDVANALNCGTTFGPIVITVNPLPAPTLTVTETSGTANDNTICPNASVTLTATGGTTYSFLINGSSVVTGPSNTYTTTAIASTSTVSVIVTNSNGCQATSAIQTITVNPFPAGSLSASSNTICAGTNVIFTATAGAGNTYNFKVDGITVQNTGANTYSTTTLTNGQVVTVDVTNAGGCTAPFLPQQLITVNALPTGTLTATENSGTPDDNSICANTPVTFTATSGFATYDFQVNGISKQNTASNTYNTSALVNNDVVSVVVKSGSNCSATFNTITITVVASPTGTLSVSPSNNICAGDDVTFTATAGFTNYNFQVNGATVSNGGSNTFSSTSLANGDIVTVDVTNSNDCISTFNSFTMVVNPLPTGILAIAETSGTANDGIICTGTTVVFTAPAGFSNYDFLLNGASVQNSTTLRTYTTSTLADQDKVTVAVTNAGGCIGLLNEYTITVNPLPVVAAITGSNNVCVNATTTLSDATTGGVWTSLNTAIATVDASGVVTGVAAGTATINYTFTNTNSCSTTVSKVITVNPLPTVAPITGNFNVCTSTDSQLADATAGGTWNSSNTAVATVDATGLVSGITAGNSTISYTVTDGNGCTTTVTALVTVTTLPTVAPITTTAPSFDVCIGGTIPLKDATSGGVWSSDDITIATINSSGVVTGVTSGNVIIRYTITTTCSETVEATQTITVNAPPSATISYTGGPFCTTSGPITVNQTGTAGGTYSSTAGLTINSADGTITPASSTGGTYTVTYTIAASGGCAIYTTTTSVTITTAPSATISYTGGPFCTTSAPVNVTRTGTAGGTYTSTAGLTINAGTGTITPATSTGGTYTVTYTIAASGGCAVYTTTTSVTITTAPSATISYTGSPFCTTSGPVNVNLTGTAGGTYSSTAGLTIAAATGTITPATSTAGTYTVTYTIAASGGCAAFTTTTSVTITAAPTAVAGPTILTCSNSGTSKYNCGFKCNQPK